MGTTRFTPAQTTRLSRPLLAACLLGITLAGAGCAAADDHIRIGSFNIAEFGEGGHPQTRDLDAIARMLVDARLDLVALQEVGTVPMGDTQVENLRQRMNARLAAGTPQYHALVTPRSGDERCAVLYRAPVIQEGELEWLDEDKEAGRPDRGGSIYYRIPVAIPFEAGEFDFYVVIVHLSWSDRTRRRAEFSALRDFLKTPADEKDWIVVGDTNRYGGYSASYANKPFNVLLETGWQTRYRLPLLEAVTDPDDMKVYRAAEDAWSTTIANPPKNDLYDQVIITAGAFREFDTDDPQLDTHVSIVAFDTAAPYAAMHDHNTVKYTISDHRPIWARFRIDLPDDD
jgi:endonuclease/exonuclease/phosphatase family metal-dependent hydrolase